MGRYLPPCRTGGATSNERSHQACGRSTVNGMGGRRAVAPGRRFVGRQDLRTAPSHSSIRVMKERVMSELYISRPNFSHRRLLGEGIFGQTYTRFKPYRQHLLGTFHGYSQSF
jgi:hypothetical protein